jgi:hypothetical protein
MAARKGDEVFVRFLGLAEASAQPSQRVVFELVHPCHGPNVSSGRLISYNTG